MMGMIFTPAPVPVASTAVAGKVELATTAETATGTDTGRAVTPDGLHDMATLLGVAWMKDEDNMASNSAVLVASQQSIKAYVDASGGGLANVVEDTTPQLGGNLDAQNNSILNIAKITAGSGAPTSDVANLQSTGSDLLSLTSTNGGVGQVIVNSFAESASPADNDEAFSIRANALDSGATSRMIARMVALFDDVTPTTMDSSWLWTVMDNANDGGANITALLSSLGVWTDASGEDGKQYEGDSVAVWGGRPGSVITDKLKLLSVGRYHSVNLPEGKEIKERHVSPTAEEFYDLFGTGKDPRKVVLNKEGKDTHIAGLAPKDMAGIALLAIQELITRVEVLEE